MKAVRYGPPRWQCAHWGCDWAGEEYLVARNPFDSQNTITGCPQCKRVDALLRGCQRIGCVNVAQSVSRGAWWTCFDHFEGAGE